MTPIEKVAFAIQIAPRADWRRDRDADTQNKYEVYDAASKKLIARFACERQARNFAYDFNQNSRARAAVAALRDPGDAVLTEVCAWGVCAGDVAAAWNAGINKILEEGK